MDINDPNNGAVNFILKEMSAEAVAPLHLAKRSHVKTQDRW
jgi:hypothetical protein